MKHFVGIKESVSWYACLSYLLFLEVHQVLQFIQKYLLPNNTFFPRQKYRETV